jgi:hypothetical protein
MLVQLNSNPLPLLLTKGKRYKALSALIDDGNMHSYEITADNGNNIQVPARFFCVVEECEESGGPKFDNTILDTLNNGGSTDYYKLDPKWKEASDIIEDRNMNYNQGNIFKAAMTFNIGRHQGTDELRDINKIIFFAERQKQLILKKQKND